MIASATRGARALSESGGIETRVIRQRMLRVPLFEFDSLRAVMGFISWVAEHEAEIRRRAMSKSRHARLVSLDAKPLGRSVHLEFAYETGDAAGQNMTTACTSHACGWILEKLERSPDLAPVHFAVEANLSGDKKANYNALLNGRGTQVLAAGAIGAATLRRVLKVEPALLMRTFRAMTAGAAAGGHLSRNLNVANIVAGAFTATGQDIGSVHECSLGLLDIEPEEDGISVSLMLPGLIVGTVGGGTHLPQQHEILELHGCTSPGGSARLAEIIAGYCMALDLSTLAAISAGHFASAHERLGRNRPVRALGRADLDASFFEPGLQRSTGDPTLQVTEVEPLSDANGSSILTALSAENVSRLVGLIPVRLTTRGESTPRTTLEVLAKIKPLDEEVIETVNLLASRCSPEVAGTYDRFKRATGFAGCHTRELALYRTRDPRFTRHVPRIYDLVEDAGREAFVIVMERLDDKTILDSVDDPAVWTPERIEVALSAIAEVHSIWWDRTEQLLVEPWMGAVPTTGRMVEMHPLWRALCEHAADAYDWYRLDHARTGLKLIEGLQDWWPELETMKRTLIHNDFNPRNVALRRSHEDGVRACIYDWELATVQVPQRDLAEFLAFSLRPDVDLRTVDAYVELHRAQLERHVGTRIDRGHWHRGYELALYDFAVTRLLLYFMAHTSSEYGFLPRVAATTQRLIDHTTASRNRRDARTPLSSVRAQLREETRACESAR